MHQPLRLLIAAALLTACADPDAAVPVATATDAPAFAHATDAMPTDYDRALADLDAQLAAAERGAVRYPDDWIRVEHVAAGYAARARLTGDLDDYLRAQSALDDAFAMAPDGSGPLLTRAHLSFTLHRLAEVEPDLAQLERRILVPDSLRVQIEALRGDVAFHSGRFEDAEARHRAAEALTESASDAFRVAYDLWQTGRFDAAERWLTVAAGRAAHDPQTLAWMHLQHGLIDLDRGRVADALAHYRQAERTFSGWWLVEEHIAEVLFALGRVDEAERLYRDVVARTGSPELTDALADVLRDRGANDEAATLRAQARAIYEEQLETLPEASYGHALSHFLAYGPVDRALGLAEANHALRPGGEATVRLAQALLVNGHVDDARSTITPLLAGPYTTAELHATAAVILRAAGDEAAAAEQEHAATAIDPAVFDGLDWLAAP